MAPPTLGSASRNSKLAVLIASMAACVAAALYFGLILGISAVYTHFFYVPIILGGLWFKRKAVLIAVLLGAVHVLSMSFSEVGAQVEDVTRACLMVVVALVLGVVREHQTRAEKTLANYRDHLEDIVTELKDANEKLTLLGSITRHDLLNHLSVLVGWLELARDSGHDPTADEEINRALESASIIREDMEFTADYERIGVKSPVWVSAKHIFLLGIATVKLNGTSVSSELDTLEIYADPMVDKVFMNLIDNSIRHGGHVTRIGVRWERTPMDCRSSTRTTVAAFPRSTGPVCSRGVSATTRALAFSW
jgi:signal transduction histidine kinase